MGTGEGIGCMATVSQLLQTKGVTVVSIGGGETVLAAATLMNTHEIGSVLVTEDDQIRGIITERDILERVVAESRDPVSTLVQDVMTDQVITCCLEDTPNECIRTMTGNNIRHLPVVCDGELCGIVTSGDILAFQLQGQRDTIEYLNTYVFEMKKRRQRQPKDVRRGTRAS